MALPRRPRRPGKTPGKLSRRARAFGRVLGERKRLREEDERRRAGVAGGFF